MALRSSLHIDIPRRAVRCYLGQETFEPGMEYHSLMVEDSEQGLIRKDFCSGCWDHVEKKPLLKKAQSHWKSSVPLKNKGKAKPQSREEAALALLRHYSSSENSEAIAEAFVLALFLARSKWIKACDEMRLKDGSAAILYEVIETEEPLCIKKIKLSELQIETLQASLAKKLRDPSETLP